LLCAFESTQISPIAWSEAVRKYDFVRGQRVRDCVDKMREVFARSFTDAFRKDSTSPVGVDGFPDDVDMLMSDYHHNTNDNQPTPSSAAALQHQQQLYVTGKSAATNHDDDTTAPHAVRYLGAGQHPSDATVAMATSEPVALYQGKAANACSSRLAAMHLSNCDTDDAHCAATEPLATIGHCKDYSALDVELKPLPMYHPEFAQASSGGLAPR
jgi:hypothetical protein